MLNIASDEVLQLDSTVYGLADAPREWYKAAREALEKTGFTNSRSDPALFVRYRKVEKGSKEEQDSIALSEKLNDLVQSMHGNRSHTLIDRVD